ncbi:hypothetical protein L1987_39881 [Smallanthus sonchifolius]|uniref:Uncharacterized protein n=1 Tax=Smallanthus sonchifolius TaxID=185202 RepID=A0ACB9GUC6_9ASTR|nr:hypothetical protein L1987_39881 [Smallanthus sonchifolius]
MPLHDSFIEIIYEKIEGPIDQDVTILGFLTENAPPFKALLVYLEHRFYGESNPVGSKEGQDPVEAMKESVKNETIRGYFNSAQALADYAELLLHIKNKLHAHNSPIIVIGGSYGGMLASWFRLKPLNNPLELKDYLESMYASAAQYNAPPKYPTTRICQGINEASNDTNILDRVFAGVVAYRPGRSCYSMTSEAPQTSIGWQWQVCSEMVIPIGITSNASMFPSSPYDVKEFIDDCVKRFGVMPRPHWVTTYYGGQVHIVWTY